MEDYEYKVVKSHATLFQNSSKFTGDISKNTGNSTSETDQIKVRGPWGGLPPLAEPPPRLYCRPEEQRLAIVSFQEDCETHGDL